MFEPDPALHEARAREVRHDVVAQLTVGTHRAFRILFAAQWVIAVLLAWRAAQPDDGHILVTFILGGMLCLPAHFFTLGAPQARWTRHWVAISQVGWSMLYAWLFEGRSDAQFHLFASLAFLAFYRDWTVLMTATTVALGYPLARLAMAPDFQAIGPAVWSRLAHQAAYVIAETLMLLVTVRQGMKTVWHFARDAARLQLTNENIGHDVQARTSDLERSREQFRQIAAATRAIPFELDVTRGCFTYVGPQAEKILGYPESRWLERGFLDVLLPREREQDVRRQFEESAPAAFEALCSVVTADDRVVELRLTVSCEHVDGHRLLRGLMIDVSDSRSLVREMAQGQKLESVGRIAAGVAHEINTSVQFISDSVRFVRHALKDVPRALADYRALAAGVLSGRDATDQARLASETDEAADVDYFLKNAPEALDRALEGIGRVGSIVRSMTEFAHPDGIAKTDVDVNRAIRNTLNMARNEYKPVAEVVTDFAEVPRVRCHAGDINQVVLNLLLNAAHAIGDVVQGHGGRGRITVRTRAISDFVEISIGDTGAGIPESVRARIFEPFVTTKEVGRGTGQGLALSRGIVVEKLRGSLHFETETGIGTTFFIRLPVSDTALAADSTNKQAAA